MTEELEGQMNLFAHATWSGKTCWEACLRQEKECRKEKTSGASSKKRQGSSKKMPLFLDLRGGGSTQESSSWTVGALPGRFTMHSSGAYRNGESGSVYWLTSTDLQHQRFCCTLSLNESPRMENPTRLSDILETETNPRYNLSPKACKGILTRASRRGKQLPEILQNALESQINDQS